MAPMSGTAGEHTAIKLQAVFYCNKTGNKREEWAFLFNEINMVSCSKAGWEKRPVLCEGGEGDGVHLTETEQMSG